VAAAGEEFPLPGAVREVTRIAAGLKAAWRDDVVIETYLTGSETPALGRSFDDLLKSTDHDIIHYAGHAVFDLRRPDQSGLVLDRGERCTAEKIHRLLLGSPLVFLNACETARLREPAATPPEGTYEGDPKEGLASAFLYGGALACIGNSWPVPDTVAAEFAVAFYRSALEGRTIGEAMRSARRETARRWPDDPSWASFVLYGDPAFNLGPFPRWDTGTATP
jgi:CHAT domain-containing protein